MPASLFITGIEDPGKYAVAGGGYSDVFRAVLKTTPVALKRLRIFQHSSTTGEAYEVYLIYLLRSKEIDNLLR